MVFGLGKKKRSEGVEIAKAQAVGHRQTQALAELLRQPESVPLAILTLDDETVRNYVSNDPYLNSLTPLISRATSTTMLEPKEIEILFMEIKCQIQELIWSFKRSEIGPEVLARFKFIEDYIQFKLRDSTRGWKFETLSTKRARVEFTDREERKD